MLELAHFGSLETLVCISSQLLIQRCHFGSLISVVMGVFTHQKEENAYCKSGLLRW